jgi:hypothetical protein
MYIRTQSHRELAFVKSSLGNTGGTILTQQYATLKDFGKDKSLTFRHHRPQEGDTFDTWPTRKAISAGERPIIYQWNAQRGQLVKLGDS